MVGKEEIAPMNFTMSQSYLLVKVRFGNEKE